mgnify:FL=1
MITTSNSDWNLQTLIKDLITINDKNIMNYFDEDNLIQVMASLKFYKKTLTFNSKSYLGITSDYTKHKFYLFLNVFNEENGFSKLTHENVSYLVNLDLSINGSLIHDKSIQQFNYKKYNSNHLKKMLMQIVLDYQKALLNIQKTVFAEISDHGDASNIKDKKSLNINKLIDDNRILPTDYYSSKDEYEESDLNIFDEELPF